MGVPSKMNRNKRNVAAVWVFSVLLGCVGCSLRERQIHAALVKWVAGEVVKWPKEKAEPVLKAALAAQTKPGSAEIAKILEEALKRLK